MGANSYVCRSYNGKTGRGLFWPPILNRVKDCFKIVGKQRIIMSIKSEFVKFKNYEKKKKSPFIIYADFERILVPGNNGKKNPNESYTDKYQKHIACCYV